jgi:hypothetical protein
MVCGFDVDFSRLTAGMDGEKVNPTLHQKGQWRVVSESRGGWGLVFYKPAGEISGHSSLLRPEENRGSLPLYFRL